MQRSWAGSRLQKSIRVMCVSYETSRVSHVMCECYVDRPLEKAPYPKVEEVNRSADRASGGQCHHPGERHAADHRPVHGVPRLCPGLGTDTERRPAGLTDVPLEVLPEACADNGRG